MDANSDSATQNRPLVLNRRHSGETSVSEVFGFPLAVNEYNTLEANQTAEIQSSEQEEDVGLVDPRTTRILRRAAMRTAEEGSQMWHCLPLYHHHLELHREIFIVALL